jgi:hypothetical protein
VEKFLTRMYRVNPDFVFTVTRDFVRNCRHKANMSRLGSNVRFWG